VTTTDGDAPPARRILPQDGETAPLVVPGATGSFEAAESRTDGQVIEP